MIYLTILLQSIAKHRLKEDGDSVQNRSDSPIADAQAWLLALSCAATDTASSSLYRHLALGLNPEGLAFPYTGCKNHRTRAVLQTLRACWS